MYEIHAVTCSDHRNMGTSHLQRTEEAAYFDHLCEIFILL